MNLDISQLTTTTKRPTLTTTLSTTSTIKTELHTTSKASTTTTATPTFKPPTTIRTPIRTTSGRTPMSTSPPLRPNTRRTPIAHTTRSTTARTITTSRSKWPTRTSQRRTTLRTPSVPNSWNIISQNRKKRSFISYWLSAGTGLAEQTELDSLKIFENDLLIREKTLASTFGNLTISENILKNDIANISDILLKSLLDEQVINEKLSELFNTQMSGDKQTNQILSILDSGLKKNNKLLQIFAELLFLQKSIDKVKKWIDNVISGKIDLFDIELASTIRNLGSNGLKSLQLAKAEIIWEKNYFTIQFTVRYLSEPFQIFGIKSLPTNMDNNENNVGSYLDIDSEIAISSNADYIFGNDFKKCSRIEETIFCNHMEAQIHTDGKNCCEVNLIHNFLKNDSTDYSSCYDKFKLKKLLDQNYIVKEGTIVLTSLINDKGKYKCLGSGRIQKEFEIIRGVNFIDNMQECGIVTSKLYIAGGYVQHKIIGSFDPKNIDFVTALIELNNHISDKLGEPFDLNKMTTLFNNTEDFVIHKHKNLKDLASKVKKLDDIKDISNFKFEDLNPFITNNSHKTLTKYLVYAVIIICLVIVITCLKKIFCNKKQICCIPCMCLFESIKCCTDAIIWTRTKINANRTQRNFQVTEEIVPLQQLHYVDWRISEIGNVLCINGTNQRNNTCLFDQDTKKVYCDDTLIENVNIPPANLITRLKTYRDK